MNNNRKELTEKEIEILCEGLNVNIVEVKSKIYDIGVNNAARVFGYEINCPDYLSLSGRLLMKWLHSVTPSNIDEYIQATGNRLNKNVKTFLEKNSKVLDKVLIDNKSSDFKYDWFSGATIIKTYLSKGSYDEIPCETPQLMHLRIATQMYWDEGVEQVIKCFDELSNKYYTHASPTIFNAGTLKPQMSSCFLYTIDDSLKEILMGVVQGGLISKDSGGLGLDISRIRHSKIGQSGTSSGIVPMLKLYNEMVRYCDQNGRRKGAVTVFNRTHHIDAYSFVEITEKIGSSHEKAHDINTSLWTSWLFWDRVRTNDKWTLFCPAQTKELNNIWGVEFDKKYVELEKKAQELDNEYKKLKKELNDMEDRLSLTEREYSIEYKNMRTKVGRAKDSCITYNVVKARDLLKRIVEVQRNSGMPYIMHGDAANMKSNHRHLGYIKSSNLCQEIVEYTSDNEIASCLVGDSLIVTDQGLRRIDNIVKDKVLVPFKSDTDFRKEFNYDSCVRINQGKRKVCTVRTSGPSITCTPDHLLLVVEDDKYKWMQAGEVTSKHKLVTCIDRKDYKIIESDFKYGEKLEESKLLEEVLNRQLLDEQVSIILGYVFANNTDKYDLSIKCNNTSLMYTLLALCGVASIVYDDRVVITGEASNYLRTKVGIPRLEEDDLLEIPILIDEVRVIDIVYYDEEEVYDLFIPNRHHFVANSVIAHNCNLASISLKEYAKDSIDHNKSFKEQLTKVYDYKTLSKISRSVTRNLNKIIDFNWYPLDDVEYLPKGKISHTNKKHRPLGIGVSGLNEAREKLDLLFESEEMRLFNKTIFACIYYNSLLESINLAIKDGRYESFEGSPFSQGKLQFDLWKEEFKVRGPNPLRKEEDDVEVDPNVWGQESFELLNGDTVKPSWDDLKRCLMKYGCRNSLLLALMPTASTAQILQNTETVEAPMSNVFSRKVLNGAYPVINVNLVRDLEKIGCWNESTSKFIVANNGSMKGFTDFAISSPVYDITNEKEKRLRYIELKYKTMFEHKQKLFLQLAADRGRYIDQSQSTNIYLEDPSDEELMSVHLMGFLLGLKTGMYYLRQKPSKEPIKFTADPEIIKYITTKNIDKSNQLDSLDNEVCYAKGPNGECLSCS